MALVLAGILAAGSVYAADVATPAAVAPAAAPAVTFTYGGLVGFDVVAGSLEDKTTSAGLKVSGLQIGGDGDLDAEFRAKAEGAKFEAQIAIENDAGTFGYGDTYLKLKFTDKVALTYKVDEDVVKVGDEVDQTVGVQGKAGWTGARTEGLRLDVKLNDAMAIDVGFVPNVCNVSDPDVEATKLALKGGFTYKAGALESISEVSFASFAKDAGDQTKVAVGQRVNYKAGNLEINGEVTYLSGGTTVVDYSNEDASELDLYVKGTMGLGGDLKAYVKVEDYMFDDGVNDGSQLIVTPGVETKALGGVTFVAELPISSGDVAEGVLAIGKVKYEF